jgi:hypothetical protein
MLPDVVIQLADRRLSDKTGDALTALTLANERTPRIFQQGGSSCACGSSTRPPASSP